MDWQKTLFQAVLLSLVIYICITSLYEWQFNDNIVRSYTVLKSDIENKLNLGEDGVITFTSDPYYAGKQLKIFSNLQHATEIVDHMLTCLYATLQNSGPLNLVLYLGYIYPLRQMLDLGKYAFYEGSKKIIVLNLGRALRFDVLDVSP